MTNLVLILMTALALVMAVIAPWLVQHAAGARLLPRPAGADGRTHALDADQHGHLRRQRDRDGRAQQLPALPAARVGPVLYNLSIIAGAWFLAPKIGVYGLVIGVVVGAVLHLDVQMIGLWWYGARYSPRSGCATPRCARSARLMGPRVVGLAAVQLNFWVNTLLASSLVRRQPLGAQLRLAADAPAAGDRRAGCGDRGLSDVRGATGAGAAR